MSHGMRARGEGKGTLSPCELCRLPPALLYFIQTPLRSPFPAFSLCIPISFSHPHTHRHTLKAVNVTNAISVEPLLTNRQQLQ